MNEVPLIPVLSADSFPNRNYEVMGSVVCATLIPTSRTFDPFKFRADGTPDFSESKPIIWFDAPYQTVTSSPVSEATFQALLHHNKDYQDYLWHQKEAKIEEIIERSAERLARKAAQRGADAVLSWRYEIRRFDMGTSYPNFGGAGTPGSPLPNGEHNAALIDFIATNLDQFFVVSVGTMVRFG